MNRFFAKSLKNCGWTLLMLCQIILAKSGAAQISMGGNGTSRAVVVGISTYQNSEIPSLQFAHRDAEEFAKFLQSPAGGGLKPNDLRLLTNEQATSAKFANALSWLLSESKENDLAIIYFSGHGDVETLTMDNLGYLLTYDSPPLTYVAGAFPISYLQSVVNTLSIKNKAKVILITDACHAGKLAGAEVKGSQATTANLSKQFANEIKILSCQPNEFSNEGVRWGGGRGVFSWYLVNGLCGLADADGNEVVTVMEIRSYLEQKVSADVLPESQIPMVFGKLTEILAVVDNEMLAYAQKNVSSSKPVGYIEKSTHKSLDTIALSASAQATVQSFHQAMRKGYFVEPTGSAAYDFLEKLKQQAPGHSVTQRLGYDLAAELQVQAQRTFNDVILTKTASPTGLDEQILQKIARANLFFEKSLKILGENNFQSRSLRAKMLFLDGTVVVDNFKKNRPIADAKPLLNKVQTMLAEYPEATFLHVLLGELYLWAFNDPERGLSAFTRAQELSPNWQAAYSGITLATEKIRRNARPNEMEEKVGAGEHQDEVENQLLAAEKQLFSGKKSEAIAMFLATAKQFPKDWVAISTAALAKAMQGNFDEAEPILLNAANASAGEPRVFSNIVEFYFLLDAPSQAKDYAEKNLKKFPHSPTAQYDWARILASQNKKDEAAQQVLKAFENGYPHPQRLKTDPAFSTCLKNANFRKAVQEWLDN